jgi:hypothetical protein
VKVGQDCILRTGFQPVPVGLFTNDPAGSPTRPTLQVAFPRRYRNASGASAAPHKRRGFCAGIHRIGYRVRNSLYFRFSRFSGAHLCQLRIYVESF